MLPLFLQVRYDDQYLTCLTTEVLIWCVNGVNIADFEFSR